MKHVVDSSAPNLDEHRTTVLQVLRQIGVSEEKLQNMIEVWNKVIEVYNSSTHLPNCKKQLLTLYLFSLNL